MNPTSLFSQFHTSNQGLHTSQVASNRKEFGDNALPEKKKNYLLTFLKQFHSPLVYILFAALFLSLALPLLEKMRLGEEISLPLKDTLDAIAICIILIINAVLGFVQEMKAENALEALRKMQPQTTIVMRNGEKKEIEVEKIVAGDLIFLAEGDAVPADMILTESVELSLDESVLTGESLPVHKKTDIQEEEKPLLEQQNRLFSGSSVTRGRGNGIVVSTGIKTEMGKIALLISEAKHPKTPLEKRLDLLGKKIALLVLGACLLTFFAALFQGIETSTALLTAIALAVGAVPEGLPAIMTISLALGVAVMARKNSLIKELKAVETLGSVSVIASDKTGTLTENNMTAVEVYSAEQKKNIMTEDFPLAHAQKNLDTSFLEALSNCNDAELPHIGDPTEIGLLRFAEEKKTQHYERISEVPFSSETKWMATTHDIEGEEIEFLKGAPEVIAHFCESKIQKEIQEQSEKMACRGLRTLAAAKRKKGEEKALFLGIVGLLDPPRKTAKQSLEIATTAGIRTIMITGDHAITAESIGARIGLSGKVISGQEIERMNNEELQESVKKSSIFARVSPQHKVRICKALQSNGEVVAMTGDGVNDAPAISQADVGISMGKVGTAVARQASDLILLDDHYASIVRGIEEGRRIFSNIKKSVFFLLRTNVSEVLLILFAIGIALPLPLLPIHLLFLNLLTDSFPALALAAEPAEKDIMHQKPRPVSEGFLQGQTFPTLFLGMVAGLFLVTSFWISLSTLPLVQAQTLTLASIVCIELFLIFSIRRESPLLSKEKLVSDNPWVFRSVALAFVLFFIALFSPISSFLQLEIFPLEFWGVPFLGALILFLCSEGMKWTRKGGVA